MRGSIDILRLRGYSYHYLIDKNGDIIQCVSPAHVAFHAGTSDGPQGSGVNEYSIGVSLVNRNDGTDPFATEQIQAATELLAKLKSKFPNLKFVTTHAAISPGRKNDPTGFPLEQFASEVGLSVWL
jgi:N-acetyl-anhydromuramyl-L-alanine amidase AmpD